MVEIRTAATSGTLKELKEHGWNFRRTCLEITHQCNCACGRCYLGTEEDRIKEPREMSLETARKILGLLKEVGTEELYITGGEPMLHSQVAKICQFAKNEGLYVILVTNGTWLGNEEKVRGVGPYVDVVEISVRSADPKFHDELTLSAAAWRQGGKPPQDFQKAGGFAAVITALQTLSRLKPTFGYRIGINHDLYETEEQFDGHGTLYEIARMLIEEKGVKLDEVYGQITSFSGRAARYPEAIKAKFGDLKSEHILQALRDIKDLKKDFGLKGGLTDNPAPVIPIRDIPFDLREFVIAEKVSAFDPAGGLRESVIEWRPLLKLENV